MTNKRAKGRVRSAAQASTNSTNKEYDQNSRESTSRPAPAPPEWTREIADRTDGTIVLGEAQVKNLLRRAALKPHGEQFLQVDRCGAVVAYLNIKNGRGGCLVLNPEDAGSPLAACLGVALEKMGCLHKLVIAPAPSSPAASTAPIFLHISAGDSADSIRVRFNCGGEVE